MKLHTVPVSVQNEISKLTDDDEFQKIFAEDKILDEAKDQKERDYRICQLVVDYLISKGKMKKFFREFWITALYSPK